LIAEKKILSPWDLIAEKRILISMRFDCREKNSYLHEIWLQRKEFLSPWDLIAEKKILSPWDLIAEKRILISMRFDRIENNSYLHEIWLQRKISVRDLIVKKHSWWDLVCRGKKNLLEIQFAHERKSPCTTIVWEFWRLLKTNKQTNKPDSSGLSRMCEKWEE
jgi:hypothetical protein